MILVTGCTGLVGRHLVLALIQKKQKVRALYRSEEKRKEVETYYAFAKAENLIPLIDWQKGDITNVPRLQEVFQGVTHVYHCAAMISFDPYQFKTLTKVNIEGTANVVNLSIDNHIQKLIHVSSIATLSKSPNNPINEQNHWNPDAEVSVYALSKNGAEMEVWRGTEEGLDTIIFNPGIILGEGDYNNGSGVIFKRRFDEKNFFPKGGSAIIDVKDLCNLMITAMNSPYNQERYIATSENISYKSLANAIAASLDKQKPTIAVPYWILKTISTLDFIKGLFTRSRTLTKTTANSLSQISQYSNHKMVDEFQFTPSPLEETLDRIAIHVKESL